MESCTSRVWATKMLIVGIVLILVRLYTNWDIWIVIGALIVLKAILLYLTPASSNAKTRKR